MFKGYCYELNKCLKGIVVNWINVKSDKIASTFSLDKKKNN